MRRGRGCRRGVFIAVMVEMSEELMNVGNNMCNVRGVQSSTSRFSSAGKTPTSPWNKLALQFPHRNNMELETSPALSS